MLYRLIRPLLFQCDAEWIHDLVLRTGVLARPQMAQAVLQSVFGLTHPALKVEAFGLEFQNPFGLAAGFDKNCQAFELLSALGFGHIELGTVTAVAQDGNSKPRIFRFPREQALINRMGFPSWGAQRVAEELKRLKRTGRVPIIGLNIGKSKAVPIDHAIDDYLSSFRTLRGLGDYYVVNVSSPNTPELRKLQEKGRLSELLRALQNENSSGAPLLVKIAPDLAVNELEDVLECCHACGISGIIATNTTLTRDGLSVQTGEAGGLSGRPLAARALDVVTSLCRRSHGTLPVVGVGGIMSGADAVKMFRAGARLVQVYTGFIYNGPAFVRQLKVNLLNYMRQNGFFSVSEIGSKNH